MRSISGWFAFWAVGFLIDKRLGNMRTQDRFKYPEALRKYVKALRIGSGVAFVMHWILFVRMARANWESSGVEAVGLCIGILVVGWAVCLLIDKLWLMQTQGRFKYGDGLRTGVAVAASLALPLYVIWPVFSADRTEINRFRSLSSADIQRITIPHLSKTIDGVEAIDAFVIAARDVKVSHITYPRGGTPRGFSFVIEFVDGGKADIEWTLYKEWVIADIAQPDNESCKFASLCSTELRIWFEQYVLSP